MLILVMFSPQAPLTPLDPEKDLIRVSALREKERAEKQANGKELQLADLGLAENCTEVKEMADEEVKEAIEDIIIGVAQSICAGR